MLVEISLLTFYTVYISVLYIGSKDSKRGYECKWKWDNIHLFPLHKGDMKICSPEKDQREIWLFRGWKFFISSSCKGNECFIPPGQRFGEFCQMKSFGHLCLQNYYFGNICGVIFTNMEYRYMTKALNLENFEKGKYDIVEREIRCFDKCHVGLFRPIKFLYK